MRLLKRFGSLHAAIQSSGPEPTRRRGRTPLERAFLGGESSVSFLKFSDLLKCRARPEKKRSPARAISLRAIHFPLNQSTCRHLFGQAPDKGGGGGGGASFLRLSLNSEVCGGHREMPVDSFKALLMERPSCTVGEGGDLWSASAAAEKKALLTRLIECCAVEQHGERWLARTIQSMRFVMEGWNGKQEGGRSTEAAFRSQKIPPPGWQRCGCKATSAASSGAMWPRFAGKGGEGRSHAQQKRAANRSTTSLAVCRRLCEVSRDFRAQAVDRFQRKAAGAN